MMYMVKRILGFSICIFLAAFLGCAAPGSSMKADNEQAEGVTPWPGGVYHPKLPAVETLNAAKKDLAGLLGNQQYMDDHVGVKYYGQLDFNKPANQNNLAAHIERVQAYMIIRDVKGEFIYMLPRNAFAVLDDRIYVSPVFTIFYTDLLDCHISVEKSRNEEIRTSWLGTDRKIYNDTDAAFAKYGEQYRHRYLRPYRIHCSGLISFFFKNQTEAQRFADDLFFIQQTLKKEHVERQVFFESKAAQYRALAVKPTVSEEQRKYVVQANALNQHKDYAGAIELYLKAVELDPVSYPGAYFNLALLSAQVQRFSSAITYMKQYLLLEPDARDARSAQDKIYEWELMMKK